FPADSCDHGVRGAEVAARHDHRTIAHGLPKWAPDCHSIKEGVMSRIRRVIPGVDPKLLIKDATKLMPDPTRRLFLRGGASLGALAFLTGCDIIDGPSAEQVLTKISYFNDRAQAWLFNSNRLAPTYPESAITRPFPFNAYYPVEEAPEVDGESYEL